MLKHPHTHSEFKDVYVCIYRYVPTPTLYMAPLMLWQARCRRGPAGPAGRLAAPLAAVGFKIERVCAWAHVAAVWVATQAFETAAQVCI